MDSSGEYALKGVVQKLKFLGGYVDVHVLCVVSGRLWHQKNDPRALCFRREETSNLPNSSLGGLMGSKKPQF